MDKADLSDWDVPRPTLRLFLTLGLGALGAALFHRQNNGYLPLPIESYHQAAAGIWVATALACVGLLRLCEREKIHWRRPRFADLLRAPAIALAAPLLLFAARPRPLPEKQPGSRMQIFSRVAFAVFPYAVAGGVAPGLLGGALTRALRPLVNAWFSFWLWGWLGCALLFLLSPWPAYPRILPPSQCKVERRFSGWGTLIFGAMMLVMLCIAWPPPPSLLALMLIAIFCFCALLSLVSPWPVLIPFPKLGELPAERKLPVMGTILLLTMTLLPLTVFGLKPFLEVVSGRIFADPFANYRVAGGLIAFTVISFFLVPYLAIVRWLSARRTPLGYWAFADAVILMFILMLSFLTISITKLGHYALAGQMNSTRTCGLIYALVAFAASLVFLAWAIWPPEDEEEAL